MTTIVDASLWVLVVDSEDPRSERARDCLSRASLIAPMAAPTLLGYELAQFIHHKQRNPIDTLAIRQTRLTGLLKPLDLVAPAWERLGAIAERHNLTACDASYLELAERLGGLLATEDHAMHQAGAKLLGAKRCVRLAGLEKLVA